MAGGWFSPVQQPLLGSCSGVGVGIWGLETCGPWIPRCLIKWGQRRKKSRNKGLRRAVNDAEGPRVGLQGWVRAHLKLVGVRGKGLP